MQCPVSNNRESDIELLAASVNPERLANNPIPLERETIKEIYKSILR